MQSSSIRALIELYIKSSDERIISLLNRLICKEKLEDQMVAFEIRKENGALLLRLEAEERAVDLMIDLLDVIMHYLTRELRERV